MLITIKAFGNHSSVRKKGTPPEEPVIKALLDILGKAGFDTLRTEEK